MSLSLVLFWKIILLLDPSKFLNQNRPITQLCCLGFLLLPSIYFAVHIGMNGSNCTGAHFIATYRYIYNINITLDSKTPLKYHSALPIFTAVLIITFCMEIGTRIYIILKKKTRRLSNKTHVLNMSTCNTPTVTQERSQQNLPKLNRTNEIELVAVQNSPSLNINVKLIGQIQEQTSQKDNKIQKSSYSLVFLIVIANLIVGISSFIMIKLDDGLVKLLVKFIYVFFNKLCLHVIPVAWILTMRPVRDFVVHKLNQWKNQF